MTGFYAAYVATLNPLVFRSPSLLFHMLSKGKRFGLDAVTLLSEGLSIMSRLPSSENRIPDHFIYDLDGGDDAVNPTRLVGYYRHYLSRLERKLRKHPGRRKGK